MNWPASYDIRVAEALEQHWLLWFQELGLSPAADPHGPGTLLRGEICDPPALFGLLTRMRDLNLTLLEVRRLEPGSTSPPDRV